MMAQSSAPVVLASHTLAPTGGEDSEDEIEVWEPSEKLSTTIASTILFSNFLDSEGKPLTRKGIKLSYENFNKWLKDEVLSIAAVEKAKEAQVFK